MKIGFTGTRQGWNERQERQFREIIEAFIPTEFHHGDCVGADKRAHDVIWEIRNYKYPYMKIIIHPPDKDIHRAFCRIDVIRGDDLMGELPYLLRNENIVSATDLLIAVPLEQVEQKRSGTWHTVRKAREQHKPIIFLSR